MAAAAGLERTYTVYYRAMSALAARLMRIFDLPEAFFSRCGAPRRRGFRRKNSVITVLNTVPML